jgi:hypothetical protein
MQESSYCRGRWDSGVCRERRCGASVGNT